MAERPKFKCWQCQEEYSLLRETEGARILFVKCPYCGAEGEADLTPWASPVTTTLRGDGPDVKEKSLNLPDVLPTRPRSKE